MHTKGLNQEARVSAFFPHRQRICPVRGLDKYNYSTFVLVVEMSCAVFLMKLRLINNELYIQEASQLINILLRERNILDHHSMFLTCPIKRPTALPKESQGSQMILSLPPTGCIVHCHLDSDQVLTVFQPRFERGHVSRCVSNDLQLAVHDHTDIILFLSGQVEIFDLFQTAPKGRIAAVWHVATTDPDASKSRPESTRQGFSPGIDKSAPSIATPNIPSVSVTPPDPTSPPKPTCKQASKSVSPLRSTPSPFIDHNEAAAAPGKAATDSPLDASQHEHGNLYALVREVPAPKPSKLRAGNGCVSQCYPLLVSLTTLKSYQVQSLCLLLLRTLKRVMIYNLRKNNSSARPNLCLLMLK